MRSASSSDYSSRKHGSSGGAGPDSPPYKRGRKDNWDNGNGGNVPDYSVYSGYMSGGFKTAPPVSYQPPAQPYAVAQQQQQQQQHSIEPEFPTQPPMLSFRQFLQQQDDSISDEDAIKKYNEYKLDFKRTQINKFFLDHRDEEW